MPEFHAPDFFGRFSARESSKNGFAQWPDEKAYKFLDDLLKVLRAHKSRVRPIGALLDTEAFFSFTWGERNFLTGGQWNKITKKFVNAGAPSRTYHVPFFAFVGNALDHAEPEDCKVHFRMDEQKVVEQGILRLFNRTRDTDILDASLRSKIGDLHPGLSVQHEGIQAADLLAHISATTYAREKTMSQDRMLALRGLTSIWGADSLDPGVIRTRGLESILQENLLPEDRLLIRELKSPAERQPPREKRPVPHVLSNL